MRKPPSKPLTPGYNPVKQAPSGPVRVPLRILLIRDQFSLQEDDVTPIRSGLADAGYELVSVANADLNLPKLIEETQPDLLIIESESAWRSFGSKASRGYASA